MQHTGRKRRVTTCVPCYARKQKCNRQYPCNHCTRRRRPEDCIFNPPAGQPPSRPSDEPQISGGERGTTVETDGPVDETQNQMKTQTHTQAHDQYSSLATSFGYFEDSSSNTIALLRNLNLHHDGVASAGDRGTSSTDITEMVERHLERMPHRQVLDFLIQYFVSELNWMKQVIHSLSFLMRYREWWTKERPLAVGDIEFAVLILRICLYTTHFLPSPSHPVDSIRGLSLRDIRDTCSDVADSLASACLSLDWKGSLARVQHIIFGALKLSCEGRTDKFWEGIACACRAAQKAGIHTDAPNPSDDGAPELQKEMRRRTFCSLYVLDSHLARQLDRVPFLPDDLVVEMLPQLRLDPDIGDMSNDANAPNVFTERLMQVQLGRFWRSFGSKQNSRYDPTQREQKYERFCAEYTSTLPPAFALVPDSKWDQHLPKLAMQRQLLYIAIFDSVCWNFRPLLLLESSDIAGLPPYKQVLLQSQKQRLALSALKELEAVSALHSMFGGSYTRFAAIIFNTFEAAIVLLSLCSHADFPFEQGDESSDILGLKVARLTREKVLRAAEFALNRLRMLANVSDMAASGSQVLAQLYVKTVRREASPELSGPRGSSGSSSWASTFSNLIGVDHDPAQWVSSDQWNNTTLMDGFLSCITDDDAYVDLQIPQLDFTRS